MRTPYKNLNGNSGIVAYEISDDAIDIEFEGGSVYTYTNSSVGNVCFHAMVALANAGMGLNAFINKYARSKYVNRTAYPPTPTTEIIKVKLGRDEAVPVLIELLNHFGVNISLN